MEAAKKALLDSNNRRQQNGNDKEFLINKMIQTVSHKIQTLDEKMDKRFSELSGLMGNIISKSID